MKWWHWLVLELLIIFGVIAWIYFFPSEIEGDFAKGMIGFVLIYAIGEYKEINRRNKMKKIKGYNIVKEKTNELLISIEIGNDEVLADNVRTSVDLCETCTKQFYTHFMKNHYHYKEE